MIGTKKKDKTGSLPKVFDRNPEIKQKALDFLDQVPAEKKKEDYEKFLKFVSGEVTWAEIKAYPKWMLKELARIAYLKYQMGDYRLAESLFKGLSIIDHSNWYYRAALGAIYQKQHLLDQAIEEYSMALLLNDKEVTSLTNRGECYLKLQNFREAFNDFESALNVDPEHKSPWTRRAVVLKKKMTEEGHGEFLERDED